MGMTGYAGKGNNVQKGGPGLFPKFKLGLDFSLRIKLMLTWNSLGLPCRQRFRDLGPEGSSRSLPSELEHI